MVNFGQNARISLLIAAPSVSVFSKWNFVFKCSYQMILEYYIKNGSWQVPGGKEMIDFWHFWPLTVLKMFFILFILKINFVYFKILENKLRYQIGIFIDWKNKIWLKLYFVNCHYFIGQSGFFEIYPNTWPYGKSFWPELPRLNFWFKTHEMFYTDRNSVDTHWHRKCKILLLKKSKI